MLRTQRRTTNLYLVFVLSAFVFLPSALSAQISNVNNSINGAPIKKGRPSDITGSPFLSDEWVTGTVILSQGEGKKQNVLMRYDALKDELQYKKGTEAMAAYPSQTAGFQLSYEGRERTFLNGYRGVGQYSPLSYFEVIYDNKVIFLKKYRKEIQTSAAPGLNTSVPERRFELIEEFFIIWEDGTVSEMNNIRHRQVLKAFPNHQDKIKKYLKSSSIRLNEVEELQAALEYYEGLL